MNKLQPPRVMMVSWEKETWFCWGEIWVKNGNMKKGNQEICYAITSVLYTVYIYIYLICLMF